MSTRHIQLQSKVLTTFIKSEEKNLNCNCFRGLCVESDIDRTFRIAETLINDKRFFISNYGWIIFWNGKNWFIKNRANVRESMYMYKVVISVCLFGCLIITNEPLDRFVPNYDLGNSVKPRKCSKPGLKIQNSKLSGRVDCSWENSRQSWVSELVLFH